MATETVAKPRTSARVHVQKFGTFLSGMIMPNIGAFIAWGLITALFIEKGWIPVPELGGFGTNAAGVRTGPCGPHDHLPAAAPDRLHRRPDGL
jgi:PTS system mannitol-specific IIC component